MGSNTPSVEAEVLAHPPVLPILPVLPHGELIPLAEDRKTACEAWEVEPERVTEVVAPVDNQESKQGSRGDPGKGLPSLSFLGMEGEGKGEQERGRGQGQVPSTKAYIY